jgi:hypothetical protein
VQITGILPIIPTDYAKTPQHFWHQDKGRLPNRPRSGPALAQKLTGMSTRFFTNRSEHTLFKKFQGVFESNPDIEFFDALIGYLRSSGYFALRPYLIVLPEI